MFPSFCVKVAFIQAAAILKARTYRMEIPEWAFAMKQVNLSLGDTPFAELTSHTCGLHIHQLACLDADRQ